MSLHDPILVFFLLSELILGVLGNSFLFSLSVHSCLRRPPLRKPIHLLLAHLSLTNALSTVFRLTPDVMSFFGGTQLFLLSDPSCRALLYAYSVTRALIISTLSLLTAFQAVTLYPGHLDWAWLNWKAPSFVFPTCLCLWIFNLLLYLPVLNHVHMQGNSSSPASAFPQAPCESSQLRYHTTMVLLCVMTTRDVFCVVLMSAASLYMVTFLYTHRQIALHLHSPRLASQLPPEIRATYSILTLVAFFGSRSLVGLVMSVIDYENLGLMGVCHL
ncbi:vomeronasal type-1 receptor 3-like [Perognathus longimembris pacificus]|uniref:vomeronasal type-1 receptor 3-like n=1 Tax=Perognathus longimembris pacificus TaxID=214514 RepID=UPI002018F5A9|nr:vomeronasal type-1 receptor 3-like [Perognathus longimembris pacificus]